MTQIVVALFVFLGIWAGPARAQAEPQEPSVLSKTERKDIAEYPVRLGEGVLFTIQGQIEDFTPKERAEAVERRILSMATDSFADPALITVSDGDDNTDIFFRNRILVSVTDVDAQPLGRNRLDLAKDYAQRIRQGIEAFREKRSMKSLLLGGILMLATTVLLIGLVMILKRIGRRLEGKLGPMVDSKIGPIQIQSFEIVGARQVRAFVLFAVRMVRFFIVIGALYAYVYLGLRLFPWTQAYAASLLNYVLVPLKILGKATLEQLPNLFFIFVLILVIQYALRLLRLFFNEIERGGVAFKGFYPEWAQPTYRICRWLVIACAAVIAFPYIPGSDSPAFKGISIFIGVLFSLGSSSALANLVAGMTLTYRRAFRIGDRVKIGEVVGDVVNMRLQVTHIRTIKNEEITIPNSTIVNSSVINFSTLAKDQGLILHTNVTIGYDAPWRQVHALLLLAAERTPGLLRDPKPFVFQTSLDDFYVTYELNAYTNRPHEMISLYSALHENIQDAFNEYGVQIMSPHYRGDPEQAKIVPKDKWRMAPAKALNEQGK